MSANFYAVGNTVDYPAGSAVSRGDMVKLGVDVGVAANDIAAGQTGALLMVGIFEIPTDATVGGGTLALGDVVDVDLTGQQVVSAGAGDADINVIVAEAKAAGVSTAKVWINRVGG